ncbi:MAG: PRC-barrel domain-containing protein, partial [Ferrovibrio sp.]|uniref:PRC-barrel domain-containing protein n=1 Tax=Ferrovibrio sp. TaxID=1917215 RepID=UPI0026149EFA
MKRSFAIPAVALMLSLPGVAVAQNTTAPAAGDKPTSDTLVPISGTGTAEVKGNRLIGADVTSATDEKLGDVAEVLVTTDGRVSAIIVATGGVLGVGRRKVVLPWERLRFSSRGNDLVVVADASRETLRAMPEYSDPSRASSEQRMPAPAEPPRAQAGRSSKD